MVITEISDEYQEKQAEKATDMRKAWWEMRLGQQIKHWRKEAKLLINKSKENEI